MTSSTSRARSDVELIGSLFEMAIFARLERKSSAFSTATCTNKLRIALKGRTGKFAFLRGSCSHFSRSLPKKKNDPKIQLFLCFTESHKKMVPSTGPTIPSR